MNPKLKEFREVWAVDFEYSAASGYNPKPICMVAKELRTGIVKRVWEDELGSISAPPFSLGPENLYISYFAIAEMSCHIELGWLMPVNVLDLFTEYKLSINGEGGGASLLNALRRYHLPALDAAIKDSMRRLAMRGGPWTVEERAALLRYCETDVVALEALLPKMIGTISVPHALLRGRYMKAAAQIEATGIPIDTDLAAVFQTNWQKLQTELVNEVNKDYDIYEGTTFKTARFEDLLRLNKIPWTRLPTGKLDMSDEAFKTMENLYPVIKPLRQLRLSLSQMRLANITIGPDGRNRYSLRPFASRTGRNQPSNNESIFGMSSFLRSLIKPTEGNALAYIDWSQQEFGIAAALSGDQNMIKAYESGDPYLEFAKQAGSAPAGATKASHGDIREQFKQCALAVLYGGGSTLIAAKTGLPEPYARDLLELHKRTYAKFWRWSEAAVNYASMYGHIYTVFGWRCKAGAAFNPRAFSNFPMQSNGAEMLRLACCFAVESGVSVCCPVHDAILIEAPIVDIDLAVTRTQRLMAQASAAVLGGFRLQSDVKIVKYPDRYVDERGEEMWGKLLTILDRCGQLSSGSPAGCS
jgi:hypothetical protein